MTRCFQCKKQITDDDNDYYYYDPDDIYCCSEKCFLNYLAARKEEEDRSFLYETIRRIHRIPFPTSRMLGEVKKYKEKMGISYRQQAAILHYIYEVICKENPWEGLTVIPKYKEEAKRYYEANRKRKEEVANFTETVAVQPVVITYEHAPRKRIKEIKEDEF